MKVVNVVPEDVKFSELKPGDVFSFTDQGLFIKNNSYVMSNNAVRLTDGGVGGFLPESIVKPINGEFVVKE